jgi:2-oxo-4-hydroxy-4-carboxy-5-ureidoimidazoline decarboxylase
VWRSLPRSDWMEAFESHPRIGQSLASEPSPRTPESPAVAWSAQEQRNVGDADAALKNALAEANRKYERRFHRIFIVCATGKSASEILAILQRRIANDKETELQEAAEQQRQITEIRLRKWLQR